MKKLNKLLAIALALVMILSLSVSAMAADADLAGHTFKAYKIFKGTTLTDGTDKLLVEDWGEGVNGAALLAALQYGNAFENAFDDCETAADVALVLEGQTDAFAREFAEAVYLFIIEDAGITVVDGDTQIAAGYYLVVDETKLEPDQDATNFIVNLALLQQTDNGTFDIAVKVDVPEVEKQVGDVNESEGDTITWGATADYDIGDEIPYKLIATMPTKLEGYDTYPLIFQDRICDGLDYIDGESVIDLKVTVNGTEVLSGYTVDLVEGGFDVIIADAFALKGANNAAIAVGAGTQIVVEYTAILNENAVIGEPGNDNTVLVKFNNNPNVEDRDPDGQTPPSEVVVFTYELVVNKTDEAGNPLEGATFTLFKWIDDPTSENAEVGAWEVVEKIPGENITSFTFTGLDDGKYKLEETFVPAGYNKAEDITFTISTEDDTTTTELELNVTAPVLKNDELGEGNLILTVENKPGALLPETGGIGTTMFYIIGGLLAVAAVVLLVTKKRMANAE